MASERLRYRGRFAPSPTGPLHFGSLVAAVGSFFDARRHGGEWYVRMEDVDGPRTVAGADADILRTLEAFGLHWDGTVMYQSARGDIYDSALDTLRRADRLYPCACSRREIADSALPGVDGPVYPGTCRNGIAPGREARAWRVRVGQSAVTFNDRIHGPVSTALANAVGDFVLRRADGFYAYQLAVVVDDIDQGMTDVVRGADLLASTARQLLLYEYLNAAPPRYAHLPVILNADGEKLSKQTGAAALDVMHAATLLWSALDVLGQHPPVALQTGTLAEIHTWALEHWRMEAVPRTVRYRAIGV